MSHFLKKLELNGFKSFADKTVLEFPAGIVAIVGPNGSGKSNVVDALRWLLGERDAKNLRGGKGEDLIFAGTQKRARVGQAQASLYFDNTNKFFPVDFEEVVVSREIRRGGQNKYFLNKSEILLARPYRFFCEGASGKPGTRHHRPGRQRSFRAFLAARAPRDDRGNFGFTRIPDKKSRCRTAPEKQRASISTKSTRSSRKFCRTCDRLSARRAAGKSAANSKQSSSNLKISFSGISCMRYG